MKKMIAFSIMFASVAASAVTISEKRATDMAAILASAGVQSLLQQNDGVGNIESITVVPSVTEAATYEIRFSSYSWHEARTCLVLTSILDSNITVGTPACK